MQSFVQSWQSQDYPTGIQSQVYLYTVSTSKLYRVIQSWNSIEDKNTGKLSGNRVSMDLDKVNQLLQGGSKLLFVVVQL